MKNYYFKSVSEKGKVKVYPVANQVMPDGTTPIDEKKAISCSRGLRTIEHVIFVSSNIKLSSTGKYYTVTGFKVLDLTNKTLVDEYNKLVKDEGDKIISSLDLYNTILVDPKFKAPSSKDDGFFMSQENWSILVRNIKKHINTLIIGPTGTGKTSCVKEVCDRLGLELHVFDMGSMIDPISSLLGVHRLEKGESIFDFAKFTQVIQKPCVILLDELNRASLGSNNILFPCLDDRRELNIEIAGSKDTRSIKVHPEVTFIATANIGSEYTGTNEMDKALVNRFFPLELGYIPDIEEINVLVKRTGVDVEKAKLIVKIANNIRSLKRKDEISGSISIRETLMVSSLVSDGWDLGKAMELVYLPLFEGTTSDGERKTVNNTLLSY